MSRERILITGAGGQLGTVLVEALARQFGSEHVLATDLRIPDHSPVPYQKLDATDGAAIAETIRRHGATQVYHLAAILSARGEADPLWAWDLNMKSLLNVFEACRVHGVQKVYYPSSIAVFGPGTPRTNTPQSTHLAPTTAYGMSKVAGELWAQYYFVKYGLDVRSLRYPGIIGWQSPPGGGTTDYAVDIYHKAVKGDPFTCFLRENTRLPMMYIDDCIRATLELMEAPAASIRVRTSYNLAAMSFTPAEQAASIQAQLPGFSISYEPDFRQAIADSWTESIDDSQARADWGWAHRFDLPAMTKDMLLHLQAQVPA